MKECKGNIHSIETFGTVDGPGIRYVIFLQGCPMRCLYCHNPDTWNTNINKLMSIDEILKQYNSLKEFYTNGGITVTGGEPLVQIDFLIELFKACKNNHIHTCLDTSGCLYTNNNKFKQLINYTDLVLLDIKHINKGKHKQLSRFSNKPTLQFLDFLRDNNIQTWIRHVVVPGITDDIHYIEQLYNYIRKYNNVKAFDLLPYHNMAISKYENLNITYQLKHISNMDKQKLMEIKQYLINNQSDF